MDKIFAILKTLCGPRSRVQGGDSPVDFRNFNGPRSIPNCLSFGLHLGSGLGLAVDQLGPWFRPWPWYGTFALALALALVVALGLAMDFEYPANCLGLGLRLRFGLTLRWPWHWLGRCPGTKLTNCLGIRFGFGLGRGLGICFVQQGIKTNPFCKG